MYGHPLGRQMEAWWKDHAGNDESESWHKCIADFMEMLDTKKDEWLSKHENINSLGEHVFGMSKSGGCTRASIFKYLGYEGEPHSGSTQFTFFLGHLVEVMALATLHQIHPVTYKDPETGKQLRVELPNMASAIDGQITLMGKPTVVSVKSTGYRMSGRSKYGKWTRRGFAQLPFEGAKETNPHHWVQLQAELAATGYEQGIILYVSKDIIKVFEEDEFLGPEGNGSLCFYAELFKRDPIVPNSIMDVHALAAASANKNQINDPLYWSKLNGGEYIKLNPARYKDGWGGKNQELTGSFNPCFGCDMHVHCEEYENAST